MPRPDLSVLVARQYKHKSVYEIALSRRDFGSDHTDHASAGPEGFDHNSPVFIASTTKLFATALILRARADGLLRLDDPITAYFEPGALQGLHVLRGQDHTDHITIRHLLCHSSGLPDYFEGKRADGHRFADAMLSGRDGAFSLQDVITATRQEMRPHFAPGTPGKALYSDTNFQLLGGILERIHGQPLEDLVAQNIAAPLGLEQTFLATPDRLRQTDVLPLRNKSQQLAIPLALSSTRLDGAGVSTTAELLRLIEGFHQGALFPAQYLAELTAQHRAIFFPLRYGMGVIRFKPPRIFDPLGRMPTFVGHSGISGAFAYFAQERGCYLAGTINQLATRALPYQVMMRAV